MIPVSLTLTHPGRMLWMSLNRIEARLSDSSNTGKSPAGEGVSCYDDRNRFREFYEKISGHLWHYIFKSCRESSLADDIFQESFFRFLRSEKPGMNDYQKKAYIYKIASHLLIDHFRRSKSIKTTEMEDNSAMEDPRDRNDSRLDLERIFSFLKPEQRTLLWLAYGEGYSHKEIADITGIREHSVRVILFRIRKKIICTHPGVGGQGEAE